MPRVSIDKNGVLIGRILHTNDIVEDDEGDYPDFDYPNITNAESDAGVIYKDVTDAEYWALFDAKVAAEQTYNLKRAALYPPAHDYLDAQAKKFSDDPVIRQQGIDQEAEYFAKCLEVKAQIPK